MLIVGLLGRQKKGSNRVTVAHTARLQLREIKQVLGNVLVAKNQQFFRKLDAK